MQTSLLSIAQRALLNPCIFSFEFFSRNDNGELGESIGEYFLSNGPFSYSENYKYRTHHEPTFGGTSIVDYGNDNTIIHLEGEFHLYFKTRPPNKASVSGLLSRTLNSGIDTLSSIIPIPGFNVRTGNMEFQDFIGLLFYARDPNIVAFSTDSQALRIFGEFSLLNKFNFSDYGLVFHDYGRNRNVEVFLPPEGITVTRSVEDTNTYKYVLNLVVLNDLNKVSRTSIDILIPNPFSVLSNAVNLVSDIINIPLTLSGGLLLLSQFVNQFTGVGKTLVSTFEAMKTEFSAEGKLAGFNFQSASKNIQVNKSSKYSDMNTLIKDFQNKNDSLQRKAIDATVLNGNETLEQKIAEPYSDFTKYITTDLYSLLAVTQYNAKDIEAGLILSKLDNNYSIYHPKSGDTFSTLAKSLLGNSDLASSVAAFNGLSANAGLGNIVLKIPVTRSLPVFYIIPKNPTSNDLENGLVGSDLALTENRDFAISPDGDLDLLYGADAFVNNLIDFMDSPLGSLEQYDFWGNPIVIGEMAENITDSGILDNLTLSIAKDPRVKSANIINESEDADQISLQIQIASIIDGVGVTLSL